MHIYIYYSKKVLPNISRTKLFIKFKTITTCVPVRIVNRQRYIAQSVYHLPKVRCLTLNHCIHFVNDRIWCNGTNSVVDNDYFKNGTV